MLTSHALARCALALLSAFLLASSLALPAAAQSSKSAPAAPAAKPAPGLTAADLEAFLEGFVPAQIERDDIAGAVVLVVKDGKVLFGKGYGYADVKTKKPVSADDTLFRPGSVSKLFTATAVMQLVEQGKLDLDRDVNDYLDFKIPATYSKPVTLRHILTHTPGFEEAIKNLFIGSAGDLTSLRQYLDEGARGASGRSLSRLCLAGLCPAHFPLQPEVLKRSARAQSRLAREFTF